MRAYGLRRKYGIDQEEYDELWRAQDGRCGICREEASGKRRLAVDHCHKTGRIRGLLCAECNMAIGKLREDPGLIRAALLWLDE